MTNPNLEKLNPRWTAGIFFAFFAILFVFFTKYTLLTLNQAKIFPLAPTLFMGLLLGGILGVLFANSLVKIRNWPSTFLIGFSMALVCLFLLSAVIFTYYYVNKDTLFFGIMTFKDYLIVAGTIFLSLLLTIGLWLLPLTGLAALYFNKHFYPGLIKASLDAK